MTPEKKPQIIELDRYRKTAEARAAKQAQAAKLALRSKERILGSRPYAGLLLLGIAVLIAGYVVLRRYL